MSRFSEAAELWLSKVQVMVNEGRRSPATVDTNRRQLTNHVLSAMGEIRLGEATTPLVDKVIAAIRADVSAATAKSCRSVISGVMGLAVRYGAVLSNPVREVERIEARPKREPRADHGRAGRAAPGRGSAAEGDQESSGGEDATAPGERGGFAATAVHDRCTPRPAALPGRQRRFPGPGQRAEGAARGSWQTVDLP